MAIFKPVLGAVLGALKHQNCARKKPDKTGGTGGAWWGYKPSQLEARIGAWRYQLGAPGVYTPPLETSARKNWVKRSVSSLQGADF